MDKKINLPITEEISESLHIGDFCYLTGEMYVARDAAHKRLMELIEKGEAYYCFCDKERLESLKQKVGDKEISFYDKHCLHLSKEKWGKKSLSITIQFLNQY